MYTYAWDAENRLIQVGLKAQLAQPITFRYDGLGRRIAIVANGVETRYLWCGKTLCQARTANDDVSRRYYPEGEVLPTALLPQLYYAQDHLGSVRDVLAGSFEARVAAYDYDPYGNPTASVGNMSADFRYAGMFYHPDSGLYLTKYRGYDPTTGRWLSRDPAGEPGGLNLYGYAHESPLSYRDPEGRAFFLFAAMVGAVWGVTSQVVADIMQNQQSSFWTYVSAAGGGVVAGIAASHGAPAWIAGLIGGATHGLLDSGLNQGGVNLQAIGEEAIVGCVVYGAIKPLLHWWFR